MSCKAANSVLTKNLYINWHYYSFLNRTFKSWNQLPTGLLASLPCELNTFRKGIKNVVTSKGIRVGTECKWVKWCQVQWCVVNWRDIWEVILCWSEVNWSEVSYVEVLRDKSNMHIRVTLNWGYLIVLWLFYLLCILYYGSFNLFCNVWVCVCVGLVMCECVYVWVF
jgi:hypothetical protein